MQDIEFDIITRECFLTIPGDLGSDLKITNNASVQNGGILVYARTPNITNPIPGIGIEQIMNSNNSNTTFEMNRWQAQAKVDGATIATWKGIPVPKGLDITFNVDYLP